jgi:hypothetical protein
LRRRKATHHRARDCRRRIAPTDRQAASHEVSTFSLQRSLAAPCRPRQTMPRAIPLRRFALNRHPRRFRFALAVFNASRFPSCTLFRWKRRWFGTFVVCLLSATYQIQHRAVLAAWPGLFSSPGDAHGIAYPSQLCSAWRVSSPFGVSRPHAVVPCVHREFHRRGARPNYWSCHGRLAVASGVWPRQAAVPCYLPAPL